MEAKILLGKILQTFKDKGHAQVPGYNRFGFVKEGVTSVTVSRENGEDTLIPFKKVLIGIEAYQNHVGDYDRGPSSLRAYGITHVTSPIFFATTLIIKRRL